MLSFPCRTLRMPKEPHSRVFWGVSSCVSWWILSSTRHSSVWPHGQSRSTELRTGTKCLGHSTSSSSATEERRARWGERFRGGRRVAGREDRQLWMLLMGIPFRGIGVFCWRRKLTDRDRDLTNVCVLTIIGIFFLNSQRFFGAENKMALGIFLGDFDLLSDQNKWKKRREILWRDQGNKLIRVHSLRTNIWFIKKKILFCVIIFLSKWNVFFLILRNGIKGIFPGYLQYCLFRGRKNLWWNIFFLTGLSGNSHKIDDSGILWMILW